MAKNYLQDGKTLTFIAEEDHHSGDIVRVGDRIVIAVTDINKGEVGTGITEGVFVLPKKVDEKFKQGTCVFVHENQVTMVRNGTDSVGVAWETAPSGTSHVAVKLHG